MCVPLLVTLGASVLFVFLGPCAPNPTCLRSLPVFVQFPAKFCPHLVSISQRQVCSAIVPLAVFCCYCE